MDENEMKSLENRLRSWHPRRPSATLSWRLFLARAASVPRMIRLAGWLTPATACALLTLLVLNSENAASTGGSRQPLIMAMLSNQSYAVSMTSRQSEQNNLSIFTFDWTNRSDSGSILRFTPFRKQTD
jgi:anti-sigma-K factor RskA